MVSATRVTNSEKTPGLKVNNSENRWRKLSHAPFPEPDLRTHLHRRKRSRDDICSKQLQQKSVHDPGDSAGGAVREVPAAVTAQIPVVSDVAVAPTTIGSVRLLTALYLEFYRHARCVI
ncbi:hypothetical protein EVAR_55106_1 [Eumeta japonica]|uniref:Uncharacterized protein n=1 Tax=Eumeta variegata TaxID=151549 RepID=A0A4C1YFB7_EUMVA|nr:hypothetical protein EVAR_55106_1 [Eumeta japonica]